MRHVISKEEVCSAWVHVDRDYAHTPTKNLSFNDFGRLYSYTTIIASRVRTNSDREVIFVTKHSYSRTTNDQLYTLTGILNSTSRVVIYVPGAVPQHVDSMHVIWKELVDEAQALWKQAQRARSRRDSIIAEGNHVLKSANKIVELFGLEVVDGIPLTTLEDLQETLRIHEAHLKLRE